MIRELQQEVDHWVKSVGVRYYSELTNLAILSEEVGEVARIISRKYGEQSFKSPEAEQEANLADELSDVLFVTICLANQTGIDLEAAFRAGMEKRTNRDRERHANNPKLK